MTFEDVKRIRQNPTAEDCDNKELAKLIDIALEKQIPKKPILDTIFPSGVKWYLCPACNHNGIEKVGGYCHKCGQALDWGDGE
jgi:hypothetical protein